MSSGFSPRVDGNGDCDVETQQSQETPSLKRLLTQWHSHRDIFALPYWVSDHHQAGGLG